MTGTTMAPAKTNTANGTVTYYDIPLSAGEQASLDIAAFTGKATGNIETPGAISPAGVAALATAAQAVVRAGQLGTMVAPMVNGMSSSTGQMEMTITNYSSMPVVPYDYSVSGGGDMSNVPDPLGTGESDSYLITSGSALTGTNIRVDFLVGAGLSPKTIQFSVYLQYPSGGPWTVGVVVDGEAQHNFPVAKQMLGFTFTGSNTTIPSFSAYVTPIETSNGILSLIICDKGS
jgi:hypothetical protein